LVVAEFSVQSVRVSTRVKKKRVKRPHTWAESMPNIRKKKIRVESEKGDLTL